METTQKITVEDAINNYVEKINQATDAHYAKYLSNLHNKPFQPKIVINKMTKWIKLIESRYEGTQQSVFCFINPANGDIYKPSGWKTPAKGVRGNVFNERLPLDARSLYR